MTEVDVAWFRKLTKRSSTDSVPLLGLRSTKMARGTVTTAEGLVDVYDNALMLEV